MPADRFLRPDDAAAALRSFPRRFRAVFAAPDDPEPGGPDPDDHDPDDGGRRIGPDGSSAADHLLAADGIVVLLDRALEQLVGSGEASLHPAFADLGTASWDDDHTPVPALLDQFEAHATEAADRVDAVDGEDWEAEGRIADSDRNVGALTITQDVVGEAAAHLRAAQAAIDAVR